MNRLLVAVVVLVVALAVGAGGAYYTGIGPAPGGDSGDRITDFPTATPSASGESGQSAPSGSDGSTTATPESPAFSFTIDQIESCGQTCRDVTATLHNNQDQPATDVTVYTRIYAGRDNTDSNDVVWEGKQEVGSLEAGASHTSTRRVELSLSEALAIQEQDGWITVVTTVESAEATVTFRNSELVA